MFLMVVRGKVSVSFRELDGFEDLSNETLRSCVVPIAVLSHVVIGESVGMFGGCLNRGWCVKVVDEVCSWWMLWSTLAVGQSAMRCDLFSL